MRKILLLLMIVLLSSFVSANNGCDGESCVPYLADGTPEVWIYMNTTGTTLPNYGSVAFTETCYNTPATGQTDAYGGTNAWTFAAGNSEYCDDEGSAHAELGFNGDYSICALMTYDSFQEQYVVMWTDGSNGEEAFTGTRGDATNTNVFNSYAPSGQQTFLLNPFRSTGNWQYFCWVRSGTTIYQYYNGTVFDSASITATAIDDSNIVIGRKGATAAGYLDGTIMEIVAVDYAFDADDIACLQNGSTCFTPTGDNITGTYVAPTPPNGDTVNTQADINLTCTNDLGYNIYFSTSNPPSSSDIVAVNITTTWTTNMTTEGTYYYFGACDNAGELTGNTSVRSLIYDTTSPSITLNSNNFFAATNDSELDRGVNNYKFNITLTDNIDLYALQYNITGTNGTNYLTYLNQSLSGLTTFNYVSDINITTFPTDSYMIIVQAADSHTDEAIEDYQYSWTPTELSFNTDEGNYIRILSDRNADWQVVKDVDRYRFTFAPYTTDAQSKYKFQVWCDGGFDYITTSGYDGHFICLNDQFKGNWLDFEGTDAPIVVTDEGDGWYEVEVEFEGNEVTFDSIGGLNVNTLNASFDVVGYYPYNSRLIINGIGYWLNQYDFTGETEITVTASDINNILQSNCDGGTIVGNYCRLNISISSENAGKIEVDIGNTINYSYGIDACTNSFSIPSNATTGNVSFLTTAGNPVNLSHEINLLYGGTTSNKSITFSKSATDFTTYLCIYPNWANLYGDLLISYTNGTADYEYNTINTYFTNVTSNFLNYITGGTTEVTFTVIDDNDFPLEDYLIKILEFDVGTNSYYVHEVIKTDSNGNAVGNIVIGSKFYQFIVSDSDGTVVLTTPTTQGVKLYSTEQTLRVSSESDIWYTSLEEAYGYSFALTYNNATDNFVFTYDNPAGSAVEGCLRVDEYNKSGAYTINDACVIASSATLTKQITPKNDSRFYARGYFKFNPEQTMTSLEKVFAGGFAFKNLKQDESGFIGMLFVLAMILIGIPFPIVSIILMAFGLLVMQIMGVYQIGFIYIGAIVLMGLINAYRGFNR